MKANSVKYSIKLRCRVKFKEIDMRIFVGSKKQRNLNLKHLVSKPNSKKFKHTK